MLALNDPSSDSAVRKYGREQNKISKYNYRAKSSSKKCKHYISPTAAILYSTSSVGSFTYLVKSAWLYQMFFIYSNASKYKIR